MNQRQKLRLALRGLGRQHSPHTQWVHETTRDGQRSMRPTRRAPVSEQQMIVTLMGFGLILVASLIIGAFA